MKSKRKSKRTPYIRVRGRGETKRYFVQIFTGRTADRRPQFIHKTFTDLTAAEAFVHETLADRKRGLVLPAAGTVSELLDDLLREQKVLGRKHNEWTEGIVKNHLRPFFGDLKIDRLTTTKLEEFVLKSKSDGLAPASINNYLARLRHAYRLGYRATPPKVARLPHFPMLRVSNTRTGFFEADDYQALLAELPVDLRPVLTFGYFTGCRRGEILGLRWPQVDLDNGWVRLERGTTKTDEPRTIPLTSQLLEVLRMQKAVRDQYWPSCPWVFFWHASGLPIQAFPRSWRSACRRAGLWQGDAKTGHPTKLFHDLRRSGVRSMIRAGIPEKVAMAVSGHKTRSVFDRYNIVSEGDLKDAARKFGNYVKETTAVKPLLSPEAENATIQ